MISERDKEFLIQVLSHFETRTNEDIQILMRIAFDAGDRGHFRSFTEFFEYVKRELLEL